MTQFSSDLADALNVLAEDRLTEADIAFDLAYEEAIREDREWERRAVDRARAERLDYFFQTVSMHLQPGTLKRDDDGRWIVVSEDDRFPVTDIVSLWDFPHSIEIRGRYYKHGKKRFVPGPKSRTWNYQRIADEIEALGLGEFRQRRANREQKSNETVAGELKKKLRMQKYSSVVQASSLPDRPVFVKYEISSATTVDRAERIVRFLREEGLLSDGMFEKEGE